MNTKKRPGFYQRVSSLFLFSRAMEALLNHEANTLAEDGTKDQEYQPRQNASQDSSPSMSHQRR